MESRPGVARRASRFFYHHWVVAQLTACGIAAAPLSFIRSGKQAPLLIVAAAVAISVYLCCTGVAGAWHARLRAAPHLVRARTAVAATFSGVAATSVAAAAAAGTLNTSTITQQHLLTLYLGAVALQLLVGVVAAAPPGVSTVRRRPGTHINRDGRPKIGYTTRNAAQTAASRQSRRNAPVSVYRCNDRNCRKYHVGHSHRRR